MSSKIKTDCCEVNEPNKDESLSKRDKLRLRKATLNILGKHPLYKKWIFAVGFKRETFHPKAFVYMWVYLKDVNVDYMDVLDIERNILESSDVFNEMLYKCEVVGSLGYKEEELSKDCILIESLLREHKINSILQ